MAKKKGNWVVRVKCEVTKELCVEGCTEEEARNNPWDYVTDEQETEQLNSTVLSVEPND